MSHGSEGKASGHGTSKEEVKNQCFFCHNEVPLECPSCRSGHTRSDKLQFLWNGYLAKEVEVAWCHICDLTWFINFDGSRVALCTDCRERGLAIQNPPEPDPRPETIAEPELVGHA